MPTSLTSAADIAPWRARLSWTQARAAAELRVHLASYKRLEGCRGSASGTLLRLAEMLELHHVPSAVVSVPDATPVSVAAPAPVAAPSAPPRPGPGLRTSFRRSSAPAPAPSAAVEPPAPTPVAPERSEADTLLDEALERCGVSAAGRPLVLAEVARMRTPGPGSRLEGGPSDIDLWQAGYEREREWQAAGGRRYPLEVVARLVAELAKL